MFELIKFNYINVGGGWEDKKEPLRYEYNYFKKHLGKDFKILEEKEPVW